MQPYHMTKKEREITDPEVIRDILRAGKYTVIGLCREGEPYVVTLSYGYEESTNTLYFHAGNRGLKLDFLQENPTACGTVIEDQGYLADQCAHAYRSVVFSGQMTIVEKLAEKKQGMEVLFQHLEENPDPIRERTLKTDKAYNGFTVLKLAIERISGKQGQ